MPLKPIETLSTKDLELLSRGDIEGLSIEALESIIGSERIPVKPPDWAGESAYPKVPAREIPAAPPMERGIEGEPIFKPDTTPEKAPWRPVIEAGKQGLREIKEHVISPLDVRAGEILAPLRGPAGPILAKELLKEGVQRIEERIPGMAAPIVGRYMKDVMAGEIQMGAEAAGILRGAGFENFGAAMHRIASDTAQTLRPPDPGFLDTLAENFGSQVVFFGLGGLTTGVANLAFTSHRIAQAFGIGAMTVAESLVEAGGVENDLLSQGAAPRKARAEASKIFLANLPLNTITTKLGFFGKGADILKRGLAGMAAEVPQEVTQTILSELFGGRVPSKEALGTTAASAAILGGLGGAGAGVATRVAVSEAEKAGTAAIAPEAWQRGQEALQAEYAGMAAEQGARGGFIPPVQVPPRVISTPQTARMELPLAPEAIPGEVAPVELHPIPEGVQLPLAASPKAPQLPQEAPKLPELAPPPPPPPLPVAPGKAPKRKPIWPGAEESPMPSTVPIEKTPEKPIEIVPIKEPEKPPEVPTPLLEGRPPIAKETLPKPKYRETNPQTILPTMRPVSSTLPILQQALVKDGKATITDLESVYIAKTALPDGSYKFVGKDMVKTENTIDDHPVTPDPNDKAWSAPIELDREELILNLERAQAAVSKDVTRLVLSGPFLEMGKDGILTITATDGRRMPVQKMRTGYKGEPFSFVMGSSAKAIKAIQSMKGPIVLKTMPETKQEGEAVLPGKSMFSQKDGATVFMSWNVPGDFPDYRRIMPTNLDKQFIFDTKELLAALKEMAPYVKANSKRFAGSPISLAHKKGIIEISTAGKAPKTVSVKVEARTINGRTAETGSIVMPWEGDEGFLTYEFDYFHDAVKMNRGPKTYLSMSTRLSPTHISGEDIAFGRIEPSKPAKKERPDRAAALISPEAPRLGPWRVNPPSGHPAAKLPFYDRTADLKVGAAITANVDIPKIGNKPGVSSGMKGAVTGIDYETNTILADFGDGTIQVFPEDIDELGGALIQSEKKIDISAFNIPAVGPIAHGPMGTARGMEKSTEETITKQAFIDHLEKAYDVPIRGKATHRFRKGKMGHYEQKAEIARLKIWGDLEAAIHEIGHAIDWHLRKSEGKKWKINICEIAGIDPAKASEELRALDYDDKQRRAHEGFAEYVRHLTTLGDESLVAPAWHSVFTQFLTRHPNLRDDLAKTKRLYGIWKDLGAEGRMAAQVDMRGELSERALTVEQKAVKAWEWFRDYWLDSGDILRRMEVDLAKKTGVVLEPDRSPFALYTYFAQKSRGVAHYMVMRGAVNWKGEIVGPGLAEILEPIEASFGDVVPGFAAKTFKLSQKMRVFILYALSRRALSLGQRGINAGFELGDTNYVFSKYDNPIWRKTSDDLTRWADIGLQWLVEAGNLSQEEHAIVRDLNPIYLMLKRVFIDEADKFASGSGRMIQLPKGIKVIRGSGRPVYNPIQAMMEQMANMVALSQKAMVVDLIAELAKVQGSGAWIVKIPPPLEARTYKIESLAGALKKEGWSLVPTDPNATLDLDGIATIFSNGTFIRGQPNVIARWKNGKREFYEIRPALYNALMELDIPSLNAVTRVTAPFSRLVRLGAVEVNPGWGLIRNPFKDDQTYLINTKGKTSFNVFAPVTGMYKLMTAKPGSLPQRFEAMGGRMSGQIGYDRGAVMSVWDQMLLTKLPLGKVLRVLKHPIDALRDINTPFEAGPRITELERRYAYYRSEKKNWSDDSCWIAAVNDGQDVSVNFTRGGIYGRQVNQAVPFFTAGIGGIDKELRVAREAPVKFLIRGFSVITIPAILSWAVNKDKKWFKNLAREYKYGNFWIETESAIFRLPMAFELGVLFGSIPMAILDAAVAGEYGPEHKKIAEAIADRALANLPSAKPAIIGPSYDVLTNKDWMGRPIESEGMQHLPIEQRTREYTLEFSKIMSRMFNLIGLKISPVQMEYLLNGYTGGLYKGASILQKDIREPADIPIVGGVILRAPDKPQKQIDDFFQELTLLKEQKNGKTIKKADLPRLHGLEKFHEKYYRPYKKGLEQLTKDKKPMSDIRAHHRRMGDNLERHGFK